ncbi:MAG: tetratricopeptide repeat protein [Proteobacteria bacterium]|nr:tetratricopeptide repeat protein [Pseudomonadota bacterium]
MRKIILLVLVGIVMVGCASPEERRDEFFTGAQKFYDEGRYEEAKVQAKNAVKVDEEFPKGQVLLGNINVKLENYRAAFNNYSKALTIDPSYHDASIGLVRLHLMGNSLEEAREVNDKVLAAEPNNRDALLLEAVLLSREGDRDAAMVKAQALNAAHPDFEDGWAFLALLQVQLDKNADAVGTLKQALTEIPESRNLILQLAGTLTRMGELDKAAKIYEDTVRKDPKDTDMQRVLGSFYLQTGKLDDAARVARDLVMLFPGEAEHRLNLAGVLQALGKNEEEGAALRQGIAAVEDNGNIKLALIQFLRRNGQLDEATAEAIKAAEADPEGDTGLNARKALVDIYISRLKYDEAEAEVAKIVEARPKDIDAKVQQGRIDMAKGDPESAVILYREVLREQPDLMPVYGLLAQAHLALDQSNLAREILEQALNENPKYEPARQALVSMYLASKQYNQALTQLRSALSQDPGNPAIQSAIGDILVFEGKSGVAEQEYRKLLSNERTAGFGVFKLGRLAMSQGEYEKGLKLFMSLHESNPANFASAEAVVVAHLAMNNVDKALVFAESLKDVLPGAGAYQLLGRVEARRSNFDQAEAYYLAGADAAPEFNAYQHIGTMYLAAGKIDEAKARFRKALTQNPKDTGSNYVMGMLLQQENDTAGAEKMYSQVLEENPKFVPALNNLAYLYAETSTDPAKLEKALDLALQASAGGASEALDTLGWVYHKMNNNQMALSTLMQALETKDDDPAVLVHLAIVHVDLGHKDQAKDYAERAAKLDPNGEMGKLASELLSKL